MFADDQESSYTSQCTLPGFVGSGSPTGCAHEHGGGGGARVHASMLTLPFSTHSIFLLGGPLFAENQEHDALSLQNKTLLARVAELENELLGLRHPKDDNKNTEDTPAAFSPDTDPSDGLFGGLDLVFHKDERKEMGTPLSTPTLVNNDDIDEEFETYFSEKPKEKRKRTENKPQQARRTRRRRHGEVEDAISALMKLINTMNKTAASRSRNYGLGTRVHLVVAATRPFGKFIPPSAFDVTPNGAIEFYSDIQGTSVVGNIIDALESVVRKEDFEKDEGMTTLCVDALARAATVELVGVGDDRTVHESVTLSKILGDEPSESVNDHAALERFIAETERKFAETQARAAEIEHKLV